MIPAIRHTARQVCFSTTALLTCAALLLAGCTRRVPVSTPTDGQRISAVTLATGEVVRISSPHVGRWENDRLTIRDRNGMVVQEYERDQITAFETRKTRVLATVGIATFGALLSLFLLADQFDPM